MKKFKVGKAVKVLRSNNCYTAWPEFFIDNGLDEFRNKYACWKMITVGQIYKVVAKAKNTAGDKFVVLQDSTGDIYLMDRDKHDFKKVKMEEISW